MSTVQWITAENPARTLTFRAPALVMVAGVTGAGKSTLLGRVAFNGAVLLEADAYRSRVQERDGHDPHAYVESSIPRARSEFMGDLRGLLASDRSLLVDATLVSAHARQELIDIALQYGHYPHVLFLDATLEQCLAGVRGRPRSVPEGKLISYYRAWERVREQLKAGETLEPELASVTVLDRAAAPLVEGFVFDRRARTGLTGS